MMTDIRDGFFHHPDGDAPVQQMQRLLNGEHNPVYDDLFSVTLAEVDGDIKEAEVLRRKLLSRLAALRKKLLSLRTNRSEIKQAVQKFDETGEIAPVLIPACNAMVAKDQAALRKADAPIKVAEIDDAKTALESSLSNDWDVTEATADDVFVYVTVKRRRAVVATERPSSDDTRIRLIEKVRQAFETYRADFLGRTQPLSL